MSTHLYDFKLRAYYNSEKVLWIELFLSPEDTTQCIVLLKKATKYCIIIHASNAVLSKKSWLMIVFIISFKKWPCNGSSNHWRSWVQFLEIWRRRRQWVNLYSVFLNLKYSSVIQLKRHYSYLNFSFSFFNQGLKRQVKPNAF